MMLAKEILTRLNVISADGQILGRSTVAIEKNSIANNNNPHEKNNAA